MTTTGSNDYNVYRELEVTTASPEKLVLMMYDGAINSLWRARESLIEGDYAAKGTFMGRAVSIIHGLLSSVDPGAGQMSAYLRSLYVYFLRRLLEADFKKDVVGIDEVMGFMKELRDAWQGAGIKTMARREARSSNRLR